MIIVLFHSKGFYGDGLECGRHGFSVRDGGFRFDMHESGVPVHPQATHPLIIEDPVNVMNNGKIYYLLLIMICIIFITTYYFNILYFSCKKFL